MWLVVVGWRRAPLVEALTIPAPGQPVSPVGSATGINVGQGGLIEDVLVVLVGPHLHVHIRIQRLIPHFVLLHTQGVLGSQ